MKIKKIGHCCLIIETKGIRIMTDPGTFTTSWNAKQRFRRIDREWEEDICAENNADFLHYEVVPLPHADRPDF